MLFDFNVILHSPASSWISTQGCSRVVRSNSYVGITNRSEPRSTLLLAVLSLRRNASAASEAPSCFRAGRRYKNEGTHHSSLTTDFRYSASPMLDLGYVREHLDVIEKMGRDRGVVLDLAAFRELDAERRQAITGIERLKAERNKASEEIPRLNKIVHGGDKAKIHLQEHSQGKVQEHAGGSELTLADAMQQRDALLAKMKTVSDEIKRGDERITELDERLKQFMMMIPNIPHASVPVGTSAADNVEVRRWPDPWKAPQFDFAPKPHWEIGEAAGILDFQAAIKIAGARFAVYKGLGARLERALANFFLDVHTRDHGFTEVLPPFLVNTASLIGVGQLPKFAADMFHVEGTDLYLTPTSEVELTSMYRDETFDADALPVKVCAWTACFRSEAGAAGKEREGSSGSTNFKKSRCSNSRDRSRAMPSSSRWSRAQRPCSKNLVCPIA